MDRAIYFVVCIATFSVVVILANQRAAHAEVQQVLSYGWIPEAAYAVVAQVRAKPGKEAELRAATLPLIGKVRAERNNLAYFLQENRERPGHFIFYEIFATQEDFEAHNRTAHVQDWFKKLPVLAEGGVEVMRMEILRESPP